MLFSELKFQCLSEVEKKNLSLVAFPQIALLCRPMSRFINLKILQIYEALLWYLNHMVIF